MKALGWVLCSPPRTPRRAQTGQGKELQDVTKIIRGVAGGSHPRYFIWARALCFISTHLLYKFSLKWMSSGSKKLKRFSEQPKGTHCWKVNFFNFFLPCDKPLINVYPLSANKVVLIVVRGVRGN